MNVSQCVRVCVSHTSIIQSREYEFMLRISLVMYRRVIERAALISPRIKHGARAAFTRIIIKPVSLTH
jgi:hypothetical protein